MYQFTVYFLLYVKWVILTFTFTSFCGVNPRSHLVGSMLVELILESFWWLPFTVCRVGWFWGIWEVVVLLEATLLVCCTEFCFIELFDGLAINAKTFWGDPLITAPLPLETDREGLPPLPPPWLCGNPFKMKWKIRMIIFPFIHSW